MPAVSRVRASSTIAAIGSWLALGCQATTPAPAATPTPAAPQAPLHVTRSGPECDAVIARAVSTADSAKVQVPAPKGVWLPPQPISPSVLGRTLHVRLYVDETGHPDLARTVITGAPRSPYLERFRAALADWRFWPGILDGCAVPGFTEITVTF
jgi:hypothetical protein